MKIIKKILFAPIIFALLILTSCKKTTTKEPIYSGVMTSISPTPYLVFSAYSMYYSLDDIPNIVLACNNYQKDFDGDIKINLKFGQTTRITKNGETIKEFDEALTENDFKEYYYQLNVFDEDENKLGTIDDWLNNRSLDYETSKLSFVSIYDKYVLDSWMLGTRTCKIPNDFFTKEEGTIYLSVCKTNKNNIDDKKALVTIKIDYQKHDELISLIAPENSFSGIGMDVNHPNDVFK